MAIISFFVIVYTIFSFCECRRFGADWTPTCDAGVMKIEQFQWQPTAVPSPGYVYYTLQATVCDQATAKVLAQGDLQMSIELLSPDHGVVPMPCSQGVGSW